MKADPIAPARQSYADALAAKGASPLWDVLHDLVPERPAPTAKPCHWSYAEMRPLLMHAGELISAEEAERRVLVLENPALAHQHALTPTLYGGLQLILPGEIARSHRHTQSAIRLVLEGSGAYTAVDGERVFMQRGDFITTPAWCWHDHGNPGSEPVTWLDGLDIPLVRALGAQFAQNHHAKVQPIVATAGLSERRYARGLLLVKPLHSGASSPLFSYPYERTREALEWLSRHEAPDPHRGHALRFSNPTTGGPALPTMEASVQWLPAACATLPSRSTESRVLCVIEGRARIGVDAHLYSAEPNDVIVVPSWSALSIQALTDAAVFTYSDRPVLRSLELLREDFQSPN